MRIFVINLKRAFARRDRMASEFASLGLPYEIHEAVDGRLLQDEHYDQVDWEGRRKIGLAPQDDASIACWLSHRQVMQRIVDEGLDMAAIFEDDARLLPPVPEVLDKLEQRPFDFDVVSMYRGMKQVKQRRFIPTADLTKDCRVGRVRFSAAGLVGYVITRPAARHFLETQRRMVYAVDHELLRFWTSGLNCFYMDPPIVLHGGAHDSFIQDDRDTARKQHKKADGYLSIALRRFAASVPRFVHRRVAFRKLLAGKFGICRDSC